MKIKNNIFKNVSTGPGVTCLTAVTPKFPCTLTLFQPGAVASKFSLFSCPRYSYVLLNKGLIYNFFAVQLPEDQRRNGRQDDDAPEATTDAGTTQPPNTITVIISRALQNIWGQWGQGVSYKNQFYLKFSLPLPLILL